MSQAVLEAIRRRQQTPALNQASPEAAMANPVPQPMPPSEMTQASAPPEAQPVKAPKFEPQDRKDLIILALTEQLKNENKAEKQQADMTPPAPEAPTPAPMGGGMPNNMGGCGYKKNMGGGGAYSLSAGYDQPMPVNQMQDTYQKDYTGLNNYGKGSQV